MLYSLACEGDGECAVLLVNIHPDAIENATLTLGEDASAVHFIGCDGRLLSDRTVEISKIEPYGFSAFVFSH